MVRYGVAHLDEIEELVDGRCPFRPVRLHFGITSFGVNAWTARAAGDRIVNEHDEQDVGDEELFLVLRGQAVFELDGDRVAATAGTLVFSPSGVQRTAFAEEAGTTIVALDGTPGKAYEPRGWELWTPLAPLYDAGEYAEVADRLRGIVEDHPRYPCCSTTSRAARASLVEPPTRSTTSGRQSPCRSSFASSQRTIQTSLRSATSRRSRNSELIGR